MPTQCTPLQTPITQEEPDLDASNAPFHASGVAQLASLQVRSTGVTATLASILGPSAKDKGKAMASEEVIVPHTDVELVGTSCVRTDCQRRAHSRVRP